jgi:hypothetical protein
MSARPGRSAGSTPPLEELAAATSGSSAAVMSGELEAMMAG